MRDPITKVIDGKNFTFYALPFKKSRSILFKISNIIAPSLANGLPKDISSSSENLDNLLDTNINIGQVVEMLFNRIDENAVNYIFDTLLENCLCDGKKLGSPDEINNLYDALFSGNLIFYMKVIKAAFEAEYGDFFGEKGILKNIKQQAAGMTLVK